MQSAIVNVNKLFINPAQYVIPPFQRGYAWGDEEQWEPLWQDIRNIAERDDEVPNIASPKTHFLGAIVLQKLRDGIGTVDQWLVVDGQQRLTTLQIVVAAAKSAFAGLNDNGAQSRMRNLLENPAEHRNDHESDAFKIRHTNPNDREDYQAVMSGNQPSESAAKDKGGITAAYYHFINNVEKWMNDDPEQRASRKSALESALTTKLEIVAITIDADEQPHMVFETLNARGEPLQQADLIKNAVMYEAEVVNDERLAGELWGMFTQDRWWNSTSKEGRLTRTQIERFLNYWLNIRQTDEVTANRMATAFRQTLYTGQWAQMPRLERIKAVCEDIRSYAQAYKDMAHHNIAQIAPFTRKMSIMEMGTAIPLALHIWQSDAPIEEKLRCYQWLESYLVRRMLCGYASNALNNILLNVIHDTAAGDLEKLLVQRLTSRTQHSRMWPNDDVVIGELTSAAMRGNAARKRMVLTAIEQHIRQPMGEQLSDTSDLTVEHIMPQTWEQSWNLPEDAEDQQSAINHRKQAIQQIGNLTLTTEKMNAHLSNGPWVKKREEIRKISTLTMNREIAEHETWDEETIAKRSRRLAEIICQIWPYPEKLPHDNQW